MIVVAGEALVDVLVRPDGSLRATPGGGPYTTARAIARLGEPVAWLGSLSDDRFGRQLEANLARDGVRLDLVLRTHLPTTLALVELDEAGTADYRFYVEGTAAPALTLAARDALPAGTRALHVGTLGLVLEPMASSLEALVATLPEHVLLVVDPNCRPAAIADGARYRARLDALLARADVVKLSGDDLRFLRPHVPDLAAASEIAALGSSVVVVTDAAGPVRVVMGGAVEVVEVPAVGVVDSIGAGDIFGGAFAAALVHGGAVRGSIDRRAAVDAARFAARAAAISCTREGAAPPELDEIGGWPSG